MSETIQVEKEVYDSVLRNSVKVADLEAENMQLRQFCEEFNALEVSEENQKLKQLLKECNHMILAYSINHDTFPKEKVKDIVTKIDEALK